MVASPGFVNIVTVDEPLSWAVPTGLSASSQLTIPASVGPAPARDWTPSTDQTMTAGHEVKIEPLHLENERSRILAAYPSPGEL
jgi:hypothetical protein